MHHIPLPNSPSTPTTSSGGSASQAFAKPLSRVPLVHSSSDRPSISGDANARDLYFSKRLSSYSSNEQLFIDVGGAECQTVDPEEDDDEDARCITPPVCQPDSTESN